MRKLLIAALCGLGLFAGGETVHAATYSVAPVFPKNQITKNPYFDLLVTHAIRDIINLSTN